MLFPVNVLSNSLENPFFIVSVTVNFGPAWMITAKSRECGFTVLPNGPSRFPTPLTTSSVARQNGLFCASFRAEHFLAFQGLQRVPLNHPP